MLLNEAFLRMTGPNPGPELAAEGLAVVLRQGQ
jgi:hypothetical protein